MNAQMIASLTLLCWLALVGGCASKQAPRGCSLTVNKLPKYEPLVIVDKKMALPAANGVVSVDSGSDVTLSCAGTAGFEAFKGGKDVEASCQSADRLEINGQGFALQDLGCQRPVRGEILVKGGKCAKGGTYMELGFKVQSTWHALVQICHHNETSSTFYATHDLYGTSLKASESKNRGGRPTFQEGGLYRTFSPDLCYKQGSQLATFTNILGSKKLAEIYTKESNLSRGHLAPNSDFILDTYQDLSFFYVNTAPQWQDVNGGNWVSVEKIVRRVAESQQATFRITTGTYGVLKMADVRGDLKEMWLYNNKTEKRLPVPEYFWKVVYDPNTQAAIAFVSLNNMWQGPSQLLCPDVCDRYGWRPSGGNWQDHRKGYIYCCDVTALRQVIEYVPRMTVKSVMSVVALKSRIFDDWRR